MIMAWKQLVFINGISSMLVWISEGVGRAEAEVANIFLCKHYMLSSRDLAKSIEYTK